MQSRQLAHNPGMARVHPKFEDPPVVETVLGVQFARLAGYSTAHAGWFWKSYLSKHSVPEKEWSKVVEAPRIPDQFERFGKDYVWPQPIVQFGATAEAQRVQIIRADLERMVQVQDSRFILNWRKQSSEYPSYEVLVPEFKELFDGFQVFVTEAGFSAVESNQWEVVYVDQIRKGDMWETPRDWPKIIPGLFIPSFGSEQAPQPRDISVSGDWRFPIEGERGRLHISLRHAALLQPQGDEVLSLTFTARGPITTSQGWEQGFAIGHEAISYAFDAVTSPEAKRRWRKRD